MRAPGAKTRGPRTPRGVAHAWGRARAAARSGCRYRSAPLTWAKSFPLRLARSVKRDAVFLPDAARIAAGGEAIDLRGSRPAIAHALAGQRVEGIDVDAFSLEQLALHARSERVLTHTAARWHHAVARHHERHDVLGAVAGHGADGFGAAGLLREPCVGPHFAARNAGQRAHDRRLQVGRIVDVDVRLAHALAAQRRGDFALQRFRNGRPLQVAAIAFRIARVQVVGRSRGDHADAVLGERDPHVADAIVVVVAQRVLARARRRDGQRLDRAGQAIDVVQRLIAALARLQMRLDFAAFVG